MERGSSLCLFRKIRLLVLNAVYRWLLSNRFFRASFMCATLLAPIAFSNHCTMMDHLLHANEEGYCHCLKQFFQQCPIRCADAERGRCSTEIQTLSKLCDVVFCLIVCLFVLTALPHYRTNKPQNTCNSSRIAMLIKSAPGVMRR